MSNGSTSMIQKAISGSAWSFIGVLMAGAFFYWQEYRNPFNLEISLVDEFNLIEVKGKIEDLKVLYENDDILESKKEIKVIRVNVENKGDTILQNYYDQLEPFGLRFYNAKVLDSEITFSNSKDLKSKLLNENVSNNEGTSDDVVFSKVIFDSGDLVTMKITLLQDSGKHLEMSPLGKLANIPELRITRFDMSEKSKPWHPMIYVAIGYFGIFLTLILLIYVMDFFEKKSKNKKIKNFLEEYGEANREQTKIIDFYRRSNFRDERLISSMLDGDLAINFSEYMTKIEPPARGIDRLFVSRQTTKILNRNVFYIEDDVIYFKRENEEFIINFFTSVLKK